MEQSVHESEENRNTPQDLAHQIATDCGLHNLPSSFRQQVLRELVRECWGELPVYSTLDAAEISVVAKATVGAGVVPIFRHPVEDRWYAVVQRPGTHYQSSSYPADNHQPYYMIAGGFLNLSQTNGIPGLIDANPLKGEHPEFGALRELTEEIVDDQGRPILAPTPDRLVPKDTITVNFPNGERLLAIGYQVHLTPDETQAILEHVARLNSDTQYRRMCRSHTINPESGKPETCRTDILPLDELYRGQYKLLHPDQQSLFDKIAGTVLRESAI